MPMRFANDNNNLLLHPTHLLVAKAAGKALGLLAAGFFVLVHLYVLWKWDMPTTPVTVTGAAINTSETTTTTAPAWYEAPAFVESQQRLQETILPKLKSELAQVTTRRQKIRDLTRRVVELQEEQAKAAATAAAKEATDDADEDEENKDDDNNEPAYEFFATQAAEYGGGGFHAPKHLQQLMETGLAAYPTEAALKQAVRLAITDVQRNIQLSNAVQWTELAAAMPATPTERQVITIASSSSSSSSSDASAAATLPANAGSSSSSSSSSSCEDGGLTHADMNAHLERIRAKLHQRGQDDLPLPISFPATLERLEMSRKEHFQTLLQQARATLEAEAEQVREELRDRIAAVEAAVLAADDDDVTAASAANDRHDVDSSSDDCIRAEQVVPWVHAGLQALYRRQDFRDALLAEMEADGLNTRGIILDAALLDGSSGSSPFDGNSNNNKQCRAPMHSLRQVLDRTPFLTQHVSEWINVAVDAVSGYNDLLDQFLDDLFASTSSGGNNDDTIGQQVVGRLLQAAGEVPLPEAIREKLQQHLVV